MEDDLKKYENERKPLKKWKTTLKNWRHLNKKNEDNLNKIKMEDNL
jgi:hypothetical protein